MKKLPVRVQSFVRLWIPLAFVATMLFGTIYSVVQQNYRQNANDPQISIVRKAATDLNHDKSVQQVLEPYKQDTLGLDPFVLVYDRQGRLLDSSTQDFPGGIPAMPAGVFSYVTNTGEDHITWQPASGERYATVVNRYDNGYIVAARSLKEVEKRENNLTVAIAAGWFFTIAASLLVILVIP